MDVSISEKVHIPIWGCIWSASHVVALHFCKAIFNWSVATLWWCTSCCWWAHLELRGLICLCSDLNPQKWECCSEVPRQSVQFWVTGRSVMKTQPSGYMSFLIKPESMVIWLVQTNLEGLWWLWRIRVWVLRSLKVWDDDVSSERKHYAAGWSLVLLSPEWTAEKASQEVMCWMFWCELGVIDFPISFQKNVVLRNTQHDVFCKCILLKMKFLQRAKIWNNRIARILWKWAWSTSWQKCGRTQQTVTAAQVKILKKVVISRNVKYILNIF